MQNPYVVNAYAVEPNAPPPPGSTSTNPVFVPLTTYQNANTVYDVDSVLTDYRRKYEIDGKYHNFLKRMKEYDSIVVADDSGSMNDLADPDTASVQTRWEELKTAIQIFADLHEVLKIKFSLYFLNRGFVKDVYNWNQISQLFVNRPQGGTDLVKTLSIIEREEGIVSGGEITKKLIHIFTDGHPTDAMGSENFPTFQSWLTNRNQKERTYYSISLCTDDERVERLYRPLEYRTGILGGGIPGVDVTMDYRGELNDIRRINRSMPFSYGDYIAKTMIGTYEPTIHNIDMDTCCGCIIM
jgi:hypothetical protein